LSLIHFFCGKKKTIASRFSQNFHFFLLSDDQGFAVIPTTGLAKTHGNVYAPEIITVPKLNLFRNISDLTVFKIRVLLFT